MIKEIAEVGSGARSIVYMHNVSGAVGHIFKVANHKGGINFVDGQQVVLQLQAVINIIN
ncbi:hypothetical protein [Snodgrassella sp. CS2]|uniref:hypothetical protein n=1 Tax=Snodgrassella sp. CS2 TaxID=3418953 RepID=UPI003D07B610